MREGSILRSNPCGTIFFYPLRLLRHMGDPVFLDRYLAVAGDRLPAQFRIADGIRVDFDRDMSEEALWSIHDEGMERFRALLRGDSADSDLRIGLLHGKGHAERDAGHGKRSLLELKAAIADRLLSHCVFCERRCGADRKKKKPGVCRISAVSRYASEFMHRGEEPELVPSHTIFFSGCNFSCVYCQNWDISTNPDSGTPILPERLAELIAMRRMYGARNVNFVTPTPHTHIILRTLAALNVNIPTVWNTNMYYSPEVARLLEGVIDVYLGDFRYGNDECAKKYSNVKNYTAVVKNNFKFAYATSGILLRQLVLPGHVECCTKPIVEWVAENIPRVRFNLMFQYTPHYRAYEYPEICRFLTNEEKMHAIGIVKKSGLRDVLL